MAAMSMEKNFKHWHGDIETTDTPLEAGKNIRYIFTSTIIFTYVEYFKTNRVPISLFVIVGLRFLCKLNNNVNFKGKEALQELVKLPLKKRLLGFTVDDPSVDLNGGEVIYRDGSRVVGYIKRAGYGYTINKHIGFGYVELEEDERHVASKETLKQILESKYELEIMGKKVVAEPFIRAPYDSKRRKILV